MSAMFRNAVSQRSTPVWLPWVVAASGLLYFIGFVDGTVHGAVLGDAGLKLNYVHEALHHARHLAFMCH
ncbi:MAG: CbtB-domain containing protein [Dehalococcoidia bacterium]|nr:CbtB-domain containing protein [Dehalococcoidia bacterium]MSQ17367.1 CbtB-domain containing protein [Dehalococcoidia bacterium]